MSDQIQRDDGEWQMLLNNAYSMVDSLTNRVEARDAQVESLQRENEELKAELAARTHNYEYWREYAESLKAAAITPEMRKRIEQRIEVFEMSPEQFPVDLALYRDLLKETVEPTLEGEQ